MRSISTFILLISVFVHSVFAHANEYLEPEESLFTEIFLLEYYQMVLSALSESYDSDVKARALIFPSFSQEHAVGIKEKEGSYSIFLLIPEKQLWGYIALKDMINESTKVLKDGKFVRDDEGISDLKNMYPKDYKDVRINRWEVKINNALAEAILSVWKEMLVRTRYRITNRLGLDGTTYHFSMSVGYQKIGGKVWSPPPDSKTGLLATISDLMSEFCQKPNKTIEKKLKKNVDTLATTLGTKP